MEDAPYYDHWRVPRSRQLQPSQWQRRWRRSRCWRYFAADAGGDVLEASKQAAGGLLQHVQPSSMLGMCSEAAQRPRDCRPYVSACSTAPKACRVSGKGARCVHDRTCLAHGIVGLSRIPFQTPFQNTRHFLALFLMPTRIYLLFLMCSTVVLLTIDSYCFAIPTVRHPPLPPLIFLVIYLELC